MATAPSWTRCTQLFPELAERRRQLASRLSGGQQQILAVAQGIIAEPHLLILDEPSGGLAPMVIDRILDVATSARARWRGDPARGTACREGVGARRSLLFDGDRPHRARRTGERTRGQRHFA